MSRTRFAIAALLLANLLLGLHAADQHSPTFDEPAHLAAGVTNLRTGDFRLLPQSPPLPHYLAALPVLARGIELPGFDLPEWRESDGYGYGVLLLHGQPDHWEVLIRSRTAMAVLMPVLGVLVWWWSNKLWGRAAGLVSLGVFSFSPTMLAHGPLVAADFVTALAFLLVVTTWWRLLRRVSLATVAASAGSLALLAVSKFSAVLATPMLVALAAIALWRREPVTLVLPARPPIELRALTHRLAAWAGAAVVQVLLVGAVIWVCYGMRYTMTPADSAGQVLYPTASTALPPDQAWDHLLNRTGWKGTIISAARDLRLLPEAWLYGLTYTLDATRYHAAFFLGEYRLEGWWYFLPLIFLMKTPLPLLAILGLAARPGRATHGESAEASRPAPSRDGVTSAPLWVLLVGYLLPAMAAGLSIGHRHLLPVLPVLYIFAGRAAVGRGWRWLSSGRLSAALVALSAAASLSIHPHYLSFFNTAAGGPDDAYRLVVDSSLDWGQDLPALRSTLDEMGFPPDLTHTEAMPSAVYLAYFGTALPPFWGLNARMLPSTLTWGPQEQRPLTPGVYSISATLLQQITTLRVTAWTAATEAVYRELVSTVARSPDLLSDGDWTLFDELRFARLCAVLRQREPDRRAGFSILVYRVDVEELARGVGGEPPVGADEADDELLRLAERSYALRSPRAAAGFFLHYLGRTAEEPTPRRRSAVVKCAASFAGTGLQESAIALLRQELERTDDDPAMYHALAWLLATSPQDGLRDGPAAVRHAERALDLAGSPDAAIMDALAAAYAETGDFVRAQEAASRALAAATLAGDQAQAADIAARISLYAAGRPYREPQAPFWSP